MSKYKNATYHIESISSEDIEKMNQTEQVAPLCANVHGQRKVQSSLPPSSHIQEHIL